MKYENEEEAVKQIVKDDSRYDREAYGFVREALKFTVKALNKPTSGVQRHVTGRELVEGIRTFAIQEFGPVSKMVLNSWGITKTDDFGDIVFNMVEKGIMGKTDTDQKVDFAGAYDFEDAFVHPYLPARARTGSGKPARRRRGRASNSPVKNNDE